MTRRASRLWTSPRAAPPARRYGARLAFVERLEPATEEVEDRDTAPLVARFQAGDQDALAVLYARYFDRVHAYLRPVLGSGRALFLG